MTSPARLSCSTMSLRMSRHFVQVNVVMREEADGGLGVAKDGGKRLVQFMSHRAGQFPQHGHAGQVRQFLPAAARRRLRPVCGW